MDEPIQTSRHQFALSIEFESGKTTELTTDAIALKLEEFNSHFIEVLS